MHTNYSPANAILKSPSLVPPIQAPAAAWQSTELSADRILQTGLAFWKAKTLLSAVELGVFTRLAEGWQTAEELRRVLGLHPRALYDFLDALVALGTLERQGDKYANTPETAMFLDRAKPTYVGGLLEMANARLYPTWGRLTRALTTGEPQNEISHAQDSFAELYADRRRLRQFLEGMTGISHGVARALAAAFPWANYRTFADVGGAQGCVLVQVALAHPHLRGWNFDLPQVGPVFEEYVRSFGLGDRLRFQGGDFFAEPMPAVDVIIMGHILHDWSLAQKRTLVAKAYEALPQGGALIVYDAIIDDARRENTFGLLMSLNMLLETKSGFDYTGKECIDWMREAGFKETRVEHLSGFDSMVVAFK